MKRHRIHIPWFLLISIPLFASSCTSPAGKEDICIGISKAAPEKYYGNYGKWLKSADSSVKFLDLYHMPLDSALVLLENCSGLLISGGPDVYPGRYGRPEDTLKCGPVDHYRDTLEFALIEKALAVEMPILGICRGLQIFNVYHGGSLYADLPTDMDTSVRHRCKDSYNCHHPVSIVDGSKLMLTSGVKEGVVNSNHHQGIRQIGDGISGAAYSSDSLIEAIEYARPDSMPFFMGVQWHPERMELHNPLSLTIAMHFLREAQLYELMKHGAH